LGHLYSISYYPAVNPNHRWRAINVKLVGERAKKYHIRTRNGYRPQPIHSSDASVSTFPAESKPLPN
jgi:Ca-activated chloride channel homolog